MPRVSGRAKNSAGRTSIRTPVSCRTHSRTCASVASWSGSGRIEAVAHERAVGVVNGSPACLNTFEVCTVALRLILEPYLATFDFRLVTSDFRLTIACSASCTHQHCGKCNATECTRHIKPLSHAESLPTWRPLPVPRSFGPVSVAKSWRAPGPGSEDV